jgi:hypothetical protein
MSEKRACQFCMQMRMLMLFLTAVAVILFMALNKSGYIKTLTDRSLSESAIEFSSVERKGDDGKLW